MNKIRVDNFDQWVNTLREALDSARAMDMSDKTIKDGASWLGEYLADNVSPDVPENQFLKQIWKISNEEEKEVLSGLMIRYVDEYGKRH